MIGDYVIKRMDIPKYINWNIEKVRWWKYYNRYGFPYSGGWAEQPAIFMDVIELLENEYISLSVKQAKGISTGRSR